MNRYNKHTEEIISFTAAKAALSVEGVGALVTMPISYSIRSREFYKGVGLLIEDDNITFDMFVNVRFGVNIPQVAFTIQEDVKNAVEEITDKKVKKVHIHVQGIEFRKNEEN